MKELSIEQKAKAYNEAIKVIKDNLEALNEKKGLTAVSTPS